MDLSKVTYENLNAKQKENFNYHKVAAALADYGYDSMRLNNDWQGADFIAVKNDEMLKVQLKGRFTINHKYKGKIYMLPLLKMDIIKLYKHDDAYQCVREHTKLTESWNKEIGGGHSWKKTPKCFVSIIVTL